MAIGISVGVPFGNSGGGPAESSEMLQDLQWGVESDGFTLKDNKEGLIVDKPELRNVNYLSFDGVLDEVIVPHIAAIRTAQTMYVNTWLMIDTTLTADNAMIAHTGSNGLGTQLGFFVDNVALPARLSINNGGSTLVATWTGFTLGVWYHYEAFSDGTAAGSWVNVDGVPFTPTGVDKTIALGIKEMSIGNDLYATSHPIHLSNLLIGTTADNIVMHMPMSDGEGLRALDVSGNGNHGDIAGATWTTADAISSSNHLDGFTDAGATFNSYDLWLLQEDMRGLSSGSYTTTEGYHSVIEASLGTTAPSVARANLVARGYTLTDIGAL